MECVAREAFTSLGLAWVVLASLEIVLEMSEESTNLPTGDVGHILGICAQAGGERVNFCLYHRMVLGLLASARQDRRYCSSTSRIVWPPISTTSNSNCCHRDTSQS